jgi:2-polyprenyl-3-methyl-5-hydroxy-6-metoxy-1,4-benzoquinol methylase
MEKFHMTQNEARTLSERMNSGLDLSKHENEMVRQAAALMPELDRKTSLDIGTGEGRWARYMKFIKNSNHVVAIDNNPTMIEIAKQKTEQGIINYIESEIGDIDIGTFDFMNAFFVTNYICDLSIFFQQAAERLSDAGQIIVSTKSINMLSNNHEESLLPVVLADKYTMLSYPHSTKKYIQSAEEAGLTIIKYISAQAIKAALDNKHAKLDARIDNLILLCKKGQLI